MFETKTIVCTRCEQTGTAKTRTKGNFLIELILWLCFFVPGIIYSIWRISSREKVCRNCGSTEIVPADSPAGKKILARAHIGATAPIEPAKNAATQVAELFKLKEQGAITEDEFKAHKAKLLS